MRDLKVTQRKVVAMRRFYGSSALVLLRDLKRNAHERPKPHEIEWIVIRCFISIYAFLFDFSTMAPWGYDSVRLSKPTCKHII